MAQENIAERDLKATVVTTTDTPALLSRVSWGAIFAGTVVAVGLLVLLGLLGTAIGFRAIDPQGSAAFDGVGMGAGIWWIASSVVALGVGGYVAGHLSGIPEKRSATAHGASVWGLLTIAMLWLAASTVGTAVNTASGAVVGAAQAAAKATDTAASAILRPGGVSEQEAENQVEGAVSDVRERINQVDQAELREDAERTAENALDALSSASWFAFIASLLSLVAAVVAAGAGAPRRAFMTAREELDLR